MGWFDPPLHNPGNRRCPSCGNPVWWASVCWWWNGSSAYLCSRCGSELRVAIGRSVLGWALCVGYYALWFWLLDSGMGYAVLPIVYGGILFLAFTLWWFTSVGLSHRVPLEQRTSSDPPFYKPGNKRCPKLQQSGQARVNGVSVVDTALHPVRGCVEMGHLEGHHRHGSACRALCCAYRRVVLGHV